MNSSALDARFLDNAVSVGEPSRLARRVNLAALIAAVVIGGAATALYVMARSIDQGLFVEVSEALGSLQALDNQLSVEVMRVSANPQADFDTLAAFLPAIRSHRHTLRDLTRASAGLESAERNALRAYLSLLDGKEERVERFKSGYAIVRNSQRYLPAAAADAAARARALGAPRLAEDVGSLRADVSAYLEEPTEVGKQRVLLALDGLRGSARALGSEQGESVSTFLAHAAVLLEQKQPMDELLATATGTATSDEAERLQVRFAVLGDEALARVRRYEMSAIALAAVAFALLVYAFISPRARIEHEPPPPLLARPERDDPIPLLNDAEDDEPPPLPEPESVPDATTAPAVEPMVEAPGPLDEQAARSARINARIMVEDIARSAAALRSQMRLIREVHVEMSQGLSEVRTALEHTVAKAADEGMLAVRDKLAEVMQVDSIARLVSTSQRIGERIHHAAGRYAHDSALDTARSEDWVDVNDCVEAALALARTDERARVERSYTDVPPILGVRDELVTLFANLLDNCTDAFSSDPLVRVKSELHGNSVAVTVIDNGRGMDQGTRESAFKMYFSTKEGTAGIGLNVVQALARRHHGQVMLNSVIGRGTAVRVTLPMSGGEEPSTISESRPTD